MAKKNALGKGLGALIEDTSSSEESSRQPTSLTTRQSELMSQINIDNVVSNPFQPRSEFDEEALNELAGSIKQLGLIQPITVRTEEDGKYQLISGERRLKACKIAGLRKIPAYIRKADDQNLLEMALVENIQREDLNSIEVAISFQRLIEECKLTQENLSERVGKKRSTVSNYLRLLKLPAEIQLGLREKQISMGHARALVNIDVTSKQLKAFNRILKDELSVRKTEDLVRSFNMKNDEANEEKINKLAEPNEEINTFTNNLKNTFKKVDLKRSVKGDGKIIISFASEDELKGIIAIFDSIKNKEQQ